jgi:hypothetical protein
MNFPAGESRFTRADLDRSARGSSKGMQQAFRLSAKKGHTRMNSIEFAATIYAKEKYSGGAGSKRRFASKDSPSFQVQHVDGKTFLVMSGALNEYAEKTWDGTPKRTYERTARIQLGLNSCEKLISLLHKKGLIQTQTKQTK